MKSLKFKLLSAVLALTLVLGSMAPAMSAKAAELDETEAVVETVAVEEETEAVEEEVIEEAIIEEEITSAVEEKEIIADETEASVVEEKEVEDVIYYEEETAAPEEIKYDIKSSGLSVSYSTHVQTYGWQAFVKDGANAGTTGQAKRLEAIKIMLDNKTGLSGSVEYSTHVQTYGWLNYVKDGQLSGTEGQAKRLEAIKIRLTGELAEYFDIYYRVHVQSIGWTTWTSNDAVSGSSGFAKRLEAIQIKIVAKSAPASERPVTGVGSYLKKIDDSQLTYSTHVQSIGDTKPVTNGQVSGSVGKGLRVENLVINLNQPTEGKVQGDIQYRTHVQGIGWTDWKSIGQMSGTTGQARRLEAIEIKLTGQLSVLYDIYYSTHVEKYGWLGWAKNGQTAGTEGIGYRMEAFKIKLVPKNEVAPGINENYYRNEPLLPPAPVITPDDMIRRAQAISSQTNWLVLVDTTICRVGIFSGSQGNWKLMYFWECAPGTDETPTVTGLFTVKAKGLSFGESHGYSCWYYTQFFEDYLFHSIIYEKGSQTEIQDPTMGVRASHGCVRMEIQNAKWIWDNIPRKTSVFIYEQ